MSWIPAFAGMTVWLVVAGHHFVFDVEDSFGDDHFQFVDLAVAGVFVAFFIEAVEDLGTVEVDFQAALIGRGELDGNIAGVLGTPEFGRQPRGEAVVASRHAIDDVHFNFAEIGTGHGHSGISCNAVVEQGDAFSHNALPLCRVAMEKGWFTRGHRLSSIRMKLAISPLP